MGDDPEPVARLIDASADGPAAGMFRRRTHALVVGLVLLGAAAVLCLIVAADPAHPLVQPVDDRWMRWMLSIRTPWLTRAARGVSALGSPFVTLPVRLGVCALLGWRRRWFLLGVFVAVIVASELCIGPLKVVIGRARPLEILVATSSSAFPSGHAIAGAVTAFGFVVVVLSASRTRWCWIAAAAAFAACMALSRTYLGAHWLTDVVAGGFIGVGLALLVPASAEMLRARLRARA